MKDSTPPSEEKRAVLLSSSAVLQTLGVVLISVGFFAGVSNLLFFGGTGLILLIAGSIKENTRSCSLWFIPIPVSSTDTVTWPSLEFSHAYILPVRQASRYSPGENRRRGG